MTGAQLGYCVCVFAVLWSLTCPGPVRAGVFDSEGNGKQIAQQYIHQPRNYLTGFIGHGSLLRRCTDMSQRAGKDIRTDGVCLTDGQTDDVFQPHALDRRLSSLACHCCCFCCL